MATTGITPFSEMTARPTSSIRRALRPALISLAAKIKIFGPKGERTVAAEEFFVTPKADTDREFALSPQEIVTDIIVPAATGDQERDVRSATERGARLAPRCSICRVQAQRQDGRGRAHHARSCGSRPVACQGRRQSLTGKTISEETALAAGEAAVAAAKPLTGNAYKVQLARIAVKRAILAAAS